MLDEIKDGIVEARKIAFATRFLISREEALWRRLG